MDKNEYASRIKELGPRLYKTAYLYLHNASDAQDVVSETVYLGLKYRKKLKQEEYFTTWITRILINTCCKELKYQKRVLPTEDISVTSPEHFDTLPLKEAIRCLPKELQEIIILRFFSCYTLSETAQILELPQGTVVTRQRKALKLLRIELDEDQEGGNQT